MKAVSWSWALLVCYFGFQLQFTLFESTCAQVLPPCKPGEDTQGRWVATDALLATPSMLELLGQRLYSLDGSNPTNEAIMSFSEVWLPHNCSYHRFTSSSLEYLLDLYLDLIPFTGPEAKQVVLSFVGDSTVRGIASGIARLAGGGNETHGPLVSTLGKAHMGKKKQLASHHQWVNSRFLENKLLLSFNFQESGVEPQERAALVEEALLWTMVEQHPLAVMYSTGLWDFPPSSRGTASKVHHKQQNHNSEYCEVEESRSCAALRAGQLAEQVAKKIGARAAALDVQLVYKNMHYNDRVGVYCADDLVERMLSRSCMGWDLLDTRPMSYTAYKHQEEDGFHFDRRYEHTVEEHQYNRMTHYERWGAFPGQLEMQLVQSYLNHIFHDTLLIAFGEQNERRL